MKVTNVRDIKCWPPGAMMIFDSRKQLAENPVPNSKPFVGVGVVVANDGKGKIWVLWDNDCKHPFVEYVVSTINERVVARG